MPKKKKIIIAVSAALAFIILAVCIAVPCVYESGLLGGAHPLKRAKEGQIRVACVGDSLTYGYGIWGWSKNNYPTQLGNKLGDGYCVNNFGYSARTASFEGDRPYVADSLYKKSLGFAPQIVIIMLGSNDTKPVNWRGKEAYKRDYLKIIQSYISLDSVKHVCVMSPSPVWNVKGKPPYSINADLIANDVRETAKEIADELGLAHIDLYEVFEDKPQLFKDGAHPNAEGAALIAEAVALSFGRYNI